MKSSIEFRYLIRQYLTLGILGSIAAVVGIGAGINSIFGGGSSSGGSQSAPSAPTSGAAASYYQPTGLAGADMSWLNALNQLNQQVGQTTGQVSPNLSAAYSQMTGIDPSGYVNAGEQAGQQYGNLSQLAQQYQQMLQQQAGVSAGAQQQLMGVGNQLYGSGAAMQGSGAGMQSSGQSMQGSGQAMQNYGMGIMGNAQPLIDSGNKVMTAAMDPQSALYAKMLQQTQDQSRSATSQRGIGMSAESAGIENQAVGNFNMDWQNQQLSRMLQGLTGQTSAYNAAGNQYGAGTQAYGAGTNAYGAGTSAYGAGTSAYGAGTSAYGAGNQSYSTAGSMGQLTGANLSGAMQMAGQAPGYTLQSGQVPFQTQQSAYGAPINAANAYTGAMSSGVYAPYSGIQNSSIPYMNNGNGAANGAFGVGQQQQGFNANQQQMGMSGLVQGANALNTSYNTPGSWLNGAFGGGNGAVSASTTYQPGGGYSGSAPVPWNGSY